MPLDTAALQSGIETLLSDMEGRTVDSKAEFAQRFSSLITDFVKSGDVAAGITLQAGIYTGVTTGTGTIE